MEQNVIGLDLGKLEERITKGDITITPLAGDAVHIAIKRYNQRGEMVSPQTAQVTKKQLDDRLLAIASEKENIIKAKDEEVGIINMLIDIIG